MNACDLAKYQRICFISKSFGTLIAGELRDQLSQLPVRSLYLTPLEETLPYLSKERCTVVVGDQDKLFADISKLQSLLDVDLHVFAGAGHSLESWDDYKKSLDMLSWVADICHDFLRMNE